MALKDWLNPQYIDASVQKKLLTQFTTQKPFPFLQLPHFLHPKKAKEIIAALAKEEFTQKESDLFKLAQTSDFISTQNPVLKEFRDFLASNEFIDFMKSISGIAIKKGAIDCNGSLYQEADFLLPHDDQLEGRVIAYICYFSTLTKKEGGALALFDSQNKKPTKVVKQLYPEFNTFTFFKVLPISFHEVQEITADVQRISINGWFHG